MAVGSLMSDDSLHSVYLIWCVLGIKQYVSWGGWEKLPQQPEGVRGRSDSGTRCVNRVEVQD